MAGIEQVLNYVKNITETLNQWAANAKKTEELPAMETMDPDGLLMVSQLNNGVWESKKIEIQKIIDGISLSGQNNNVREVLLGTITATQNLNYLLDNNGITVTEDEIIVLTALTTINATLVQKQYLWKLGKGEYNPIGSANIATKMLELQPRLLNEIISDELTSSPSAVVYDFGVISNTVLENINNANPAYNFTDDEKIYYIRYIKNDVKILYNFIGINNNYGLGQSQMTQADLVLVYSSANSDPTELLNTKLDKGGYQGNAQDLSDSIQNIYQPDTVIRYTAPTRVGNTFTFPSGGYDVLLSKQFHTNTSELETTIAAATDGFKRIDLIYYKADDTIAKIQGTESATVAVRPEVPAGGIELCLINVFGATIEVPEVNGAYVQKSERANVVLTGSGVINQLNLVDEKATIVFKGSITRLNTISYASVPYNGKTIRLFNAQATPVTIGHSVSGYGVDFVFLDGQDYILLPNQTIEFSFDITYAPYAHHMLIGAVVDSQIEVNSNTNISNLWNGKTVLFTANCTITVPATLLPHLGFVFRTLAGVTVTWQITAPFTWETTPTTTPEKTTGSFMRRGNTNTILLDF